MQTYQRSEHYSDMEHGSVMTRTTVLNYAQLARIAGHLRRNAEDSVFSTNPFSVDNCRIAATMLSWAFNLVPTRIVTEFDY